MEPKKTNSVRLLSRRRNKAVAMLAAWAKEQAPVTLTQSAVAYHGFLVDISDLFKPIKCSVFDFMAPAGIEVRISSDNWTEVEIEDFKGFEGIHFKAVGDRAFTVGRDYHRYATSDDVDAGIALVNKWRITGTQVFCEIAHSGVYALAFIATVVRGEQKAWMLECRETKQLFFMLFDRITTCKVKTAPAPAVYLYDRSSGIAILASEQKLTPGQILAQFPISNSVIH